MCVLYFMYSKVVQVSFSSNCHTFWLGQLRWPEQSNVWGFRWFLSSWHWTCRSLCSCDSRRFENNSYSRRHVFLSVITIDLNWIMYAFVLKDACACTHLYMHVCIYPAWSTKSWIVIFHLHMGLWSSCDERGAIYGSRLVLSVCKTNESLPASLAWK